METLIEENKIDKAKDVIDIAMTNMPVEHYYFYAFVEPFVDGYYKVGETEKARELYGKLKKIYQEHLEYYSSIPLDEQYEKIDDILSDMQAYRRNIDILIDNKDREFAESETVIFNEYIDKFSQFVDDGKEELLEEPSPINPDLEDSIPLDTIGAIRDSIVPQEQN